MGSIAAAGWIPLFVTDQCCIEYEARLQQQRKNERKQSSKQAIRDDHVAHVVPKGAALYSVAAATRDQRHGNLSWKNNIIIIIIIIIFLVQSKTTMKYTRVCRIDICISCM
jgi:hypothetical protein